MISRLLVGLLTDGHILLEGVPGLAKTTAIKSLAKALSTSFQRIQFTPDLLPADLIGTMIYMPGDGTFKTRKGPSLAAAGPGLVDLAALTAGNFPAVWPATNWTKTNSLA